MTNHLQYIFQEKKHPAFPMNLGSENEVNPPLDGHWIGKEIVQSIGLGDILLIFLWITKRIYTITP